VAVQVVQHHNKPQRAPVWERKHIICVPRRL
jgi:hypothetical protein